MSELIDVTGRLVIRELGMNDINTYQNIIEACALGVLPDLVGLSADEFAERHEAYIKYQYGFYGYGIWGVFLKGSVPSYDEYLSGHEGPMIGIVGLVNGSASGIGELSYAILPKYRRNGYALEAVRAAMEYGTECGFKGFEAVIEPSNTASLALAAKLGVTVRSLSTGHSETDPSSV